MSARRYYDDLVVGEKRESHEETVELDALLAFSRAYDPQYFHADPEAARNSVFGEVIASGIYTMALWRKLDHEISGDIAWICGIAWEDVKWPVAVRAGDRLRAQYRMPGEAPVVVGRNARRGRVPLHAAEPARRDRVDLPQHQPRRDRAATAAA